MSKRRRPTTTFLPNPPLLPPLRIPTQSKYRLSMRLRPTAAAILSALLLVPSAHALTPPQRLVAEAWRVVDEAYVDKTFNHIDWFQVRMRAVRRAYPSTDASHQAIRDMLALLKDPYTRFLSPEQFQSLSATATGELAGVGVELMPGTEVRVSMALDDSPAAKAGVRPRDRIVFIDGEDVSALSPDEAAARIRGRPGTRVQLTVLHEGGAEESFTMTRESLKLQSVKVNEMKKGEIYVKIKQFNSSTAADMKDALEGVSSVKRIILDLRDNPGGYFPGGVDVARLFVKASTPIVYVVDKNGVQDEINAIVDGEFADIPMVVLVNQTTASASEILAGALKDTGRAKLVGQQTYGKGVVQTVSQLSDGSGIAVTIARYETPSHNDINKIGISPDVKSSCTSDAEVHSCFPPDVWGA